MNYFDPETLTTGTAPNYVQFEHVTYQDNPIVLLSYRYPSYTGGQTSVQVFQGYRLEAGKDRQRGVGSILIKEVCCVKYEL